MNIYLASDIVRTAYNNFSRWGYKSGRRRGEAFNQKLAKHLILALIGDAVSLFANVLHQFHNTMHKNVFIAIFLNILSTHLSSSSHFKGIFGFFFSILTPYIYII